MIPRERFCNKLNSLDYTFQRQADRVMIYRRPRDQHRVSVPRKKLLDEDYVRTQLSLCGLTADEIETFIGATRCGN